MLTPAGHELAMENRRRRRLWFAQRIAALSDGDRAVLEAAVPVIGRMLDPDSLMLAAHAPDLLLETAPRS